MRRIRPAVLAPRQSWTGTSAADDALLDLLDQEPRFDSGERRLTIWNDQVPAFLLPELVDQGYEL
jgi:hypothetical protein